MTSQDNIFIHPTAIVESPDTIGSGSYIGPYCIVGKDVQMGVNTTLQSHVVIDGHTTLGNDNFIHPHATLGLPPQDIKYKNEPTKLVIGNNNVFREHVTIHRATSNDRGKTTIGNHCFFMVGTHIAHDCEVGNHAIFANNATLAGHVTIGNNTIIGGLTAIHQFVRIGSFSMIGGVSALGGDVLPFSMAYNADGNREAKIMGLNIIGMKRNGFERSDIRLIKNSFDILYKKGIETLEDRIHNLNKTPNDTSPAYDILLKFINSPSKRGLCEADIQKYA